MNTSDILNKAADLIEERGWTAGVVGMMAGGGNVCLEGAISIITEAGIRHQGPFGGPVLRFPQLTCPAYRAVWEFLQTDDRWGPFRERVYDWNDAVGRTQAEVIEVLRAIALVEAARETQPAEVSL